MTLEPYRSDYCPIFTNTLHLKGIEDRREVLVKLNVDNGTNNLGHAPHGSRVYSSAGMEAGSG